MTVHLTPTVVRDRVTIRITGELDLVQAPRLHEAIDTVVTAGALTGRPTLDGYLPNTGIVVRRSVDGGWELESVDQTAPAPGDVTGGAADD